MKENTLFHSLDLKHTQQPNSYLIDITPHTVVKRMLFSLFLFVSIRLLSSIFQTNQFEDSSQYCDVSSKDMDIMVVDLTFDSLHFFHKNIILTITPFFNHSNINFSFSGESNEENHLNNSFPTLDYDIETYYMVKKQFKNVLYNGTTIFLNKTKKFEDIVLFRQPEIIDFNQIQLHLTFYAEFEYFESFRLDWKYTNLLKQYFDIFLPFFIFLMINKFIIRGYIMYFSFSSFISILFFIVCIITLFPFSSFFDSGFDFIESDLIILYSFLFRLFYIIQLLLMLDQPTLKKLLILLSLILVYFVRITSYIFLFMKTTPFRYISTVIFIDIIAEVILTTFIMKIALQQNNNEIMGNRMSLFFYLVFLNNVITLTFENTIFVSLNVIISLIQFKTWLYIYVFISLFYFYFMQPQYSELFNIEKADSEESDDVHDNVLFEEAKQINDSEQSSSDL